MIARLLAAMALLMPLPALASDNADWEGVYEGKVGRYPVTVCFQTWGDGSGFGAYYYHSQKKPIRLNASGDPARWAEAREGEGWGEQTGPRWQLKGMGNDTVSGTWRDGKRTLPVTLRSVADDSATDGLPCGSAAFLAKRTAPATFERTDGAAGVFAFTRLTYKVPAHFADVTISGFTFAPSRPGDAAIVRELEAGLPRGKVDDEFIQCIGGALGSMGSDGYWEQSSSPGYVDQSFIAVESSLGTFCGGAHPNFGSYQRVFDRDSGREVELATWLGESAWGETEYDSKPLAPTLRQLAMQRWPGGSDPECREAASEQSYWLFGISADGFNLTPDFPHVLTACEETATVPWAEIEPFLSAEGKRGRARMGR